MSSQADSVQLPEPTIQRVPRPKKKSIYCSGIFQIIGGAILILCGLLLVSTPYDISYRNKFDNSVCGIWSGAIVLVTGIIGVLGASRKSWLKAYLGLNLVSLTVVIVAVVIGAVAAADNVHYYKRHPGYYHSEYWIYPDQHGISITKLSFHLLLSVVGSLDLIVCILAAVFCCTGICPGDVDEKTVYYSPAPHPERMASAPNYLPPNYAYPPPSNPSQQAVSHIQSDETKQ